MGAISSYDSYASGLGYLFTYDTEHAAASGSVTAVSCAQSDVQNAVNQALSGDSVFVPSGNCSWTSAVTIANKVNLIGAGSGSTKISLSQGAQLNFGTSDASMTGFGFSSSAKGTGDVWFNVRGDGGWRIHHNTFTNTAGVNNICFYVSGGTGIPHPLGVFDHNTFNDCRIYVIGDLSLTGGTIWNQPTGWGTNNAVFIEDNTFVYDLVQGNCIDAQYSGRFVARFNTITGCNFEAHAAQNGHATRSWEIYNNNWAGTGNDSFMATFLRGGTGIIFSNTFVSGYSQALRFDDVRPITNNGGIWTLCNGTAAIDGNAITSGPGAGWPCRDQLGRGKDSSLFVSGSAPYPSQASEPVAIFLNRQSGSQPVVNVVNGTTDYIKNCRDFQNETSAFNGSCGTGIGAASARPATCTTGVYYWATDEGEWNSTHSGNEGRLYKCTSTNTWSVYYTPYTYPHPLTLGSAPTPPPPPSTPPPPPSSDTTPPTVSITVPSSGATVSGTGVTVSATASDNVGVAGVQFKLDGANLNAEDTSSPYTTVWNTTSVTNGSHILTAVARDSAGNKKTSSNITLTVNNVVAPPSDTTPPAVSITSPVYEAIVSGSSVTVSATASDNVGVAGVQFKLDGTNLGAEDLATPYSIVWNTTTATNASHILTATARDSAGNKTTSVNIAVIVSNGTSTPPPPPPPVSPPVTNRLPVGYFDQIRSSDGAVIGWDYDPDQPSTSGTVQIFFNGPAGSGGTLVYSGPTNILRNDVNTAYSISGIHGVEYNIPASYRDNKAHSVYMYGIDLNDPTKSATLIGSPKTFTLAPPVAPPPPTPTSTDTTAPIVSITNPANNAFVTKNANVSIQATATDNVGISKVEIYINGTLKCSDTTAPYSCAWKVPKKSARTYRLQAKAFDTSGNQGISAINTVTAK